MFELTLTRRSLAALALFCCLGVAACSDDVDGDPTPGTVTLENNARGDMKPDALDMPGSANDQGIGTVPDMRDMRDDMGTPGLVDMEPPEEDMSSPHDMRPGDMTASDMPSPQRDMSAPQDMASGEDMTTPDDMGVVMLDMADMTPSVDMMQPVDMEPLDMAPVDMALPSPCTSGASGEHAARFMWEGNGPGSTAYVVYETNTLPDTSRWKAGAYGRSVGYTPVFDDTFLGEGGLVLSGTNFMHIELSTAMMPPINTATIAIYGRSYNTTSPGSFSWLTFSGSGSSPYGMVANSAPYQWYTADATSALPAGDAGMLIRLEAQGPSNRLIVRRVEICFDI